MLDELHVRNLGVVEEANLVLGPGMTAITGETGAGKTLLTEAIRLLIGGRADAHMVRNGSTEARVDGRFITKQSVIDLGDEKASATDEDYELIVARTIPASGRGRAYLNGSMASIADLQSTGSALVDIHGQNAHQSLLNPAAQRHALDAFAQVDLSKLQTIRRSINQIGKEIEALGGDARSRARELDLLKFQLVELDAAELSDNDEDAKLLAEETLLADAEAHRAAATEFHELLAGDGGASEKVAGALAAAKGRSPLKELETRLRAISAELDDIALESAEVSTALVDDPERLSAIQDRRAVLKSLQRKYGSTVAEMIAYREELRGRVADLESHDEVVAALEADREARTKELHDEERRIGRIRRKAAPGLSAEVEVRLRELALPNARFEIEVGEDLAGDEVTFLLGPNPGMPMLPMAKAASGGELARSMLALRLALIGRDHGEHEAETLIFDEVDAGIGGEAAVAVGKALASVATASPRTQVFVVTHLAQVAAFANQQINVQKKQGADSTNANIRVLAESEREIELARMLSGIPESESGVLHARELLQEARSMAGAAKVKKSKQSKQATARPKAKTS